MSILLVDDFDEERDFLQAVLLKAGYGPVVTAESGRQALELLGIMGRRVTPCEISFDCRVMSEMTFSVASQNGSDRSV